jgi:cell division protein FtsQ
LLAGAGWVGYDVITSSQRFALDDIRITGATRLGHDEIRAQLGVAVGDNIFAAAPEAISERLHAHPWVASASVRRELPNALAVEVREHQPLARVALGARVALVDRDGAAFKWAEPNDGSDVAELLLIDGVSGAVWREHPERTQREIVAAVAAAEMWRRSGRAELASIKLDGQRGLSFVLAGSRTEVRFGVAIAGSDLAPQLATFDAAWAALADSERRRARTLHLDRADRVVVALRDANERE